MLTTSNSFQNLLKPSFVKIKSITISTLITFLIISGCSDNSDNLLSEQYRYDSNGRLISKVSPNGEETRYTYDDKGMLVKIDYPEEEVLNGYDGNGNRIWINDETGITEFYYDPFDRLAGVIWKHGLKKLVAYDYDPRGSLTRITVFNLDIIEIDPKYENILKEYAIDQGGTDIKWKDRELQFQNLMQMLRSEEAQKKQSLTDYEVEYRYDIIGNISAIETKWGIINYSYFWDKGIVERRLPNGINSTFTYSPEGLLESIHHENKERQLIAEYKYEYNSMGKVISVLEIYPEKSKSTKYIWDKRGYLSELQLPDGKNIKYEYDAMGNRVVQTNNTGSLQYEYDSYERLIKAGNVSYDWDKNGNMIKENNDQETTQIMYNSRNFPFIIDGPETAMEFRWDGDGNMIYKQQEEEITNYLPDFFGAPATTLAEFDDNGKIKNSYIYGDVLIGQEGNKKQINYFLEDGFNSIRLTAGNDGNIIEEKEFTPFAEPQKIRGDLSFNFRTAGERYLPGVDKYLIENRLYDPQTGRYLSPDPEPGFLERYDSFNKYTHGQPDPNNFMEPKCYQTRKGLLPLSDIREFWKFTGEPQGIKYNFLELLGQNSNWIGHRRSGGEWINPGGIGPMSVSPINRFDDVARVHDINVYLSNLYPAGTEVDVSGPQGLEKFVVQSKRRAFWILPFDRLFKWKSNKKDEDKEKSQRIDEDISKKWRSFPPPPPCPPFCGDDGGGGGGAGVTKDNNGSPFIDPFSSITKQLGGIELSSELKFEGSIGNIVGAVYDPEKNCIVLLGNKNFSVPSIKAEDLAVALVSVFGENPFDPQFSLDPDDPQNPRGKWLKAVYIPKDAIAGTEFGKTMFETDWLLKQYSFGVKIDSNGNIKDRKSIVPGFKSVADLSLEQEDKNVKETWNRFWIVVKELEDDPEYNMRLRESEDGKSFYFDDIKMKIEVKKQVVDPSSPTGLRDVDTEDDPIALKFAKLFTNLYDDIALESEQFERLKELAKAVGLAKWMEKEGINIDPGWVNEFANKRIQTINKITAISFVKEKRDTTTNRFEGGYKYQINSSQVHLFGGVDLTVEPKFDKNPNKAGQLREIVLSKLKESDESPLFIINYNGTTLHAIVLPLNREGQKIWENSSIEEKDGVLYQFDPNKKNIIKSISESGTTYYSYDIGGDLSGIEINNNNGWNSTGKKSESGSAWVIINPKGNKYTYKYDASGLLTGVEVNGKQWVAYDYNIKENQIDIQYQNNFKENYIYDNSGWLTKYTYYSNYDKTNTPTTQSLNYYYDKDGLLSSINAEGSNNWTIKISDINERSSGHPPNGGNGGSDDSERNQHLHEHTHHDSIDVNKDGKLKSVKLPGFKQALYKYNSKGRLTEIYFPNGGWLEYKYEKDNTESEINLLSIINHSKNR